MRPKRQAFREARERQRTGQELRDALMEFLRSKFYPAPEHWLAFQKDRPRLLAWVVLWPAKWLDERGVSLPAARYQELVVNALMEGLRHGNTGGITYLPGWLGKVVQSHFAHNEDAIYAEARALRPGIDRMLRGLQAVAVASRPADPVREMALAAGLLKAKTRARRADSAGSRSAAETQLGLL
jgi:hypothetical protein